MVRDSACENSTGNDRPSNEIGKNPPRPFIALADEVIVLPLKLLILAAELSEAAELGQEPRR